MEKMLSKQASKEPATHMQLQQLLQHRQKGAALPSKVACEVWQAAACLRTKLRIRWCVHSSAVLC